MTYLKKVLHHYCQRGNGPVAIKQVYKATIEQANHVLHGGCSIDFLDCCSTRAFNHSGVAKYIHFRKAFSLSFRQLSLYCLVDEVLRRGEIMPDEKKKLTFHYFFMTML